MDRRKELHEIERRQLTSVMNETRWKRLNRALSEALCYAPPYQIKYLGEDTLFPSESLSEYELLWGEWEYIWMESSLQSIEWIRLRPKVLIYKGAIVEPDVFDMTDELISTLKKNESRLYRTIKRFKFLAMFEIREYLNRNVTYSVILYLLCIY